MAQVEDENQGSSLDAVKVCRDLDADIRGDRWNMFDFRLECKYGDLCYDFSQAEKFFNRKDVQKVLGVKPKEWNVCDGDVYDAM